MKHTRVPQTVRRDTWRLAIEISSIPSLQSFRSRIPRNHVASRVENRKEPNETNRRSNQLTKKKIPHTLCHVELSLGLIDQVQGLHQPRTIFQKQRCRRNHNYRTLLQAKRVCSVQTLYQHQSALPYLGCCTVSSCSFTKGPRVGQKIQWTKAQKCIVHDVIVVVVDDDDLELLRRSSAGQLELNLSN